MVGQNRYKGMENVDIVLIEKLLENLDLLIKIGSGNKDDETLNVSENESVNDDEEVDKNIRNGITVNMKVSDDLTLFSSIGNLIQKILNFKEEIVKALDMEMDNFNPNDYSKLSDKVFFDYLMAYLKSTTNTPEYIDELERSYKEYMINKNKDIFKSKVENEITNKDRKKINKTDIFILESNTNNPHQSKVLVDYIAKYPKNSNFVITLVEKAGIDKACKFLKGVNEDKLSELLEDENSIKNLTELISELKDVRSIINLIEDCKIIKLTESLVRYDILITLIGLINNVSNLSDFLNEIKYANVYIRNIYEEDLSELLNSEKNKERVFHMFGVNSNPKLLTAVLRNIEILNFIGIMQSVGDIDTFIYFITSVDTDLVTGIINNANPLFLTEMLDKAYNIEAFSSKLNELDNSKKFNELIEKVDLGKLIDLSFYGNIFLFLEMFPSAGSSSDFINRTNINVLIKLISHTELYGKYIVLIHNIGRTKLDKLLENIDLDDFISYLESYATGNDLMISYIGTSTNTQTSIDFYNIVGGKDFYNLLLNVGDAAKLNNFISAYSETIQFISDLERVDEIGKIIANCRESRLGNLINNIKSLPDTQSDYEFFLELINETTDPIGLALKINTIPTTILGAMINKGKGNNIKLKFSEFLHHVDKLELNELINSPKLIDKLMGKIKRHGGIETAITINNKGRLPYL